MQLIEKRLKKIEKQLVRGDKKKIAERLDIPYTNVTTAFDGKASVALSFDVLEAAIKVISSRKNSIKRRLKKIKV